jgi:hypothetical protein
MPDRPVTKSVCVGPSDPRTNTLAEPEISRKIVESGLSVVPMSIAEFNEMVKSDHERYGRLIRAAGIKAD